ncbi:MAG TPA: GNAT family N-acetyltransferase [Ktedonobacteraceae bacterium]|nr:GNAT family N-acetyltransferase [Ktedonobacteraceae bacterium]
MPELEVRQAREEDREAVLVFCRETWEWGDYIADVWDTWLHDENGALLVAVKEGKPVGIANLRMLNAQEAWMEGMRVDPAFRQQGVASALFDAQIAEARRRGASTARLITNSTNTSAIRLIERTPMRRVGAYAIYETGQPATDSKRTYGLETPVLATPEDIDEVIDYLNVSNIFPSVGGLYYQGFTAFTITAGLIEQKITAGQIYLLRRWQRLDGLVMCETREWREGRHLFIGYIDGTTESISLLAYALRAMLPQLGLEKAQAHIPDLMMVRDAFVGAEYEWDGHVFYTYEWELI